ncbi:MAG: nucleotidyltransferase family protein [Bacteroidia bacterium]|nr:nucleotidyltransferase family protein [Bacteroidia bacterium]
MKPGPCIGAVMLAAGASRRLGQPKQLLPFRGRPLLQHAMEQAEGLPLAARVLVLGAHAADIQARIEPGPWAVAVNPGWEAGMGSSLRCGLAECLRRQPELEHLLLLLSDQPFVDQGFLNELIHQHLHKQHPITASEYAGVSGVPVIFSRAYFPELMALGGDQGARRLLSLHADAVRSLPFEGGSFDIDTPEDAARLGDIRLPS